MRVGIAIVLTDESVDPATVARMAEERGVESLFVSEHTHIPAVRRTPYGRGELPREYARTLDPFVALTAAAAATTTLRLGTGVCLLVERDPIVTAKAAASVDLLSHGRLELGVGAGWNEEEMENHGTDPATRFGLLRERVEAMRAIWTDDEASYHGRHVSFDRIWCWPKPLQRPGPPVLVAGNGARVVDRVLRYGDGWMPRAGDDDVERIRSFRTRCEQEGRPELSVSLYNAPAESDSLARLAGAGLDRAIVRLPSATAPIVESRLDAVAELI